MKKKLSNLLLSFFFDNLLINFGYYYYYAVLDNFNMMISLKNSFYREVLKC